MTSMLTFLPITPRTVLYILPICIFRMKPRDFWFRLVATGCQLFSFLGNFLQFFIVVFSFQEKKDLKFWLSSTLVFITQWNIQNFPEHILSIWLWYYTVWNKPLDFVPCDFSRTILPWLKHRSDYRLVLIQLLFLSFLILRWQSLGKYEVLSLEPPFLLKTFDVMLLWGFIFFFDLWHCMAMDSGIDINW